MNFKILLSTFLIFDFLSISNVFSNEKIIKSSVFDVLHNTDNYFNDTCSINIDPVSYEDFHSGCELVSIVNLLNYYKYKIDLNSFYNNYFIHRDWTTISYENKKSNMVGKIIFGPHPDYAFPGDPKIVSGNNCGFGCFKYAVCDSINEFLKKYDKIEKYKAKFEEGISTDDALSRFVKKGIPVLIWSTQPDDRDIPVEERFKYALKMRKSGGPGNWWLVDFPDFLKGTIYIWTRGEHCSLLIGESDKCYKICDPFRGIIYVEKESLNESRKIFNNQIVYLEECLLHQIENTIDIILNFKN